MKINLGIPNELTYRYATKLDYIMLYIVIIGLILSLFGDIFYFYPSIDKDNPGFDIVFPIFTIIFVYDLIWAIKYISLCIPEEEDD